MNGVVASLLRISCRQRNPTKDRDFPNVVINSRATTVLRKKKHSSPRTRNFNALIRSAGGSTCRRALAVGKWDEGFSLRADLYSRSSPNVLERFPLQQLNITLVGLASE